MGGRPPQGVDAPMTSRSSRGLASLALALLATLPFLVVAHNRVSAAGGNWSVLLSISPEWFDSNPQLKDRTAVRESLVLVPGGYDGQFNYFAVFDPLMTRYDHAPDNYGHMMDAAPYRFGRIGQIWLTRLIAGDHWRSYPVTMVTLTLLGIVLTGWALGQLAIGAGHSPLWAASVLMVPGFWQSSVLGLPEPLAAAGVLWGYLFWRKGWRIAALLTLASSLLVRETGAVFVAALIAAEFVNKRYTHAALVGLVGVPLVVWRIHVGNVLFPIWGWEGYFYNPHNLGLPFAGMFEMWQQPSIGLWPMALSVLIIGATAAGVYGLVRTRSFVWAVATCYGLVAVCFNYPALWVHVGNVQRGSYELFALLLAAWVTSRPGPHSSREELPLRPLRSSPS
jgi:hypothetical protein